MAVPLPLLTAEEAADMPTFDLLELTTIEYPNRQVDMRLVSERSGRQMHYFMLLNGYRIRPNNRVRTEAAAEAWFYEVKAMFAGRL